MYNKFYYGKEAEWGAYLNLSVCSEYNKSVFK